MSDTIRMISPCIQSLQRRKSHHDSFLLSFVHQFSDSKRKFSFGNLVISPKKTHAIRAQMTPETAWGVEDSLQNIDSPVSIDLQPINSEGQFDRFIAEAQQLEESVIVVWMASWCRKCIYLKPKLEKLAADYYPRIRFYCVDVNTVPHRLVVHAGITKMPTIQLWKDSKKQAEVIGGHKAYLVVNEVREMIENEYSA